MCLVLLGGLVVPTMHHGVGLMLRTLYSKALIVPFEEYALVSFGCFFIMVVGVSYGLSSFDDALAVALVSYGLEVVARPLPFILLASTCL